MDEFRSPRRSIRLDGQGVRQRQGAAHCPWWTIVVASYALVKAGLRSPPAAASALTRAQLATSLLTIRSMNRSGPKFEGHPFDFQKRPLSAKSFSYYVLVVKFAQ